MKRRFPWQWLIGGGALALLATLIDAPFAAWLSSDKVRRAVEHVLDPLLAAGAYGVILAILAAYPNRQRLCIGFVTTVAAAALVLHGLKLAIGRARPLAEKGSWHFEPFSGHEYMDAFPSGHAAATATLALLLGLYFPRARWVFYLIALLVGIERVVKRWHYPSDVIAGYVLAGAVVFTLLRVLGPSWYRTQTDSARPLT
jgi:membrane-associated phospholipid phosphatase